MATTHTVRQGEYLSSIAKKFGYRDWKTIYEHPQNHKLKERRPNPDILLPGDQIFIPDKQKKEESCNAGQSHRFKVTSSRNFLQIILKDDQGEPLANVAYTLKVAGQAKPYQASTDGSGLLKQEFPVGVESAELSLGELGLTWNLEVGHLDPVDEVVEDKAIITGVQARLNNLGFHCGKVDGILGPMTKEAIRRFQEVILERKNPDGEPDKQTREALVREYGC